MAGIETGKCTNMYTLSSNVLKKHWVKEEIREYLEIIKNGKNIVEPMPKKQSWEGAWQQMSTLKKNKPNKQPKFTPPVTEKWTN